MIQVRCVQCDEVFEVSDAAAGQSEFCPACGTLNDVPPDAPEDEDIESGGVPHSPPPLAEAQNQRGVPGWIWWPLLACVLTAFGVSAWRMTGDNWERTHLAELTNMDSVSVDLMSAGDFSGAADECEKILAQIGDHPLESAFLQEMLRTVRDRLPRARRDAQIAGRVREADALASAKQWGQAAAAYSDAIAMTPEKTGSADPLAATLDHARQSLSMVRDARQQAADQQARLQHTSSTMPDDQSIQARITRFQRASEAFPGFVSSKPQLYLDDRGKWRRQQYVVWGVNSEIIPASEDQPPRIQLEYQETTHSTAAHETREQAAADADFTIQPDDRTVYHRTEFKLTGVKWIAQFRSRGDGQTWISARDKQFARAGNNPTFERQDLWSLEDETFSN